MVTKAKKPWRFTASRQKSLKSARVWHSRFVRAGKIALGKS